ncbi:exostosin family-domain-containing protein [Chytriomyces sp. MP71]|nr:exostosin family-domain-containing protein [Chytriomyces sp. MP71]
MVIKFRSDLYQKHDNSPYDTVDTFHYAIYHPNGAGKLQKRHPMSKWFLIPHHTTCVYHACVFDEESQLKGNTDACKAMAARHIESILDRIITEYPYWNRTGGSDHMLVFSWDQASEVIGYHSPIRKQISSCVHLTSLGTRDPNASANFDINKDIVIPPFANYTAAFEKFPTAFKSYNPIVDLLTSRLFSSDWSLRQRPVFAYFRGTIIEEYRYSFGVRQYIKELGVALPDRYFIREGHVEPNEYWEELANSTFSLCPSGWSPWSPRLFDSIIALSIPVVFADDSILPFESEIPYHNFVVRIRNADVGTLDSALKSISEADIRRKKLLMIKYREKLVWWRQSNKSEGGAFALLLKVLENRTSRKEEL